MKTKLKVGDFVRIVRLPGSLKNHKYLLPTHLEKTFKSFVKRKTKLKVDDITNDTVWLIVGPDKTYGIVNIDINENIWRKVK